MVDKINENKVINSNDDSAEQPKIWRISHSNISTPDHSNLLENNLLAIGFLGQLERGVTTIRDRFIGIKEGDFFYLVRNGYIVLFGQFGEINKTGVINVNMDAFTGQEFAFSENLNRWLCRQIIINQNMNNLPFNNGDIICDDNVRRLFYMPSGQSTVFEVPRDRLGQFETNVLKPVFDLELETLTIKTSTVSSNNSPNPTQSENLPMITLNRILFGPPGTGKTYNTVNKAILIVNPGFFIDEKGKKTPRTREDLKKEFDNYIKDGQIVFTTFHQSMSYEDFIEGIKPLEPSEGDAFVKYEVQDGIFKKICEEATEDKDKNYVLIIDEINRGNVSHIFGELITLIEDDKRLGCAESLVVTLPYSKEQFGVPKNLYIIGTMNTADRSVEALDAALRRRFSFEEMPPNSDLIGTEGALNEVGGILDLEELGKINLPELLDIINLRIEKLLDRDHQIGHSYFMSVESLDDLKLAFQNKIIPLLQEYFFGDYGKIGLVLGKVFDSKDDSNKNNFADFSDVDADEFSERPIFKIKTHISDDDFIKAINSLLNKKTNGE